MSSSSCATSASNNWTLLPPLDTYRNTCTSVIQCKPEILDKVTVMKSSRPIKLTEDPVNTVKGISFIISQIHKHQCS